MVSRGMLVPVVLALLVIEVPDHSPDPVGIHLMHNLAGCGATVCFKMHSPTCEQMASFQFLQQLSGKK